MLAGMGNIMAITHTDPDYGDKTVLHEQKQTPRPSVRERTIPTDRPPLVGEI
jgi:hypothetical protein